jgi:hypothetical protein
VIPAVVAVTVIVPALIPKTRPPALTVAKALFEVDHDAELVMFCDDASL